MESDERKWKLNSKRVRRCRGEKEVLNAKYREVIVKYSEIM